MSFLNAAGDLNISGCLNLTDITSNLGGTNGSPSFAEEDAFKNIFHSCDTNNAGKVPVSVIVDFIAPWMQQQILGLKELKNTLDPNCLNPSISLQEFCDGMRKWTETFQPIAEMSNNNEHNLVTPCKMETRPLFIPQSTPISDCNKQESKQRGKILFNNSDSPSYSSNEIHIDDYILLQETVKELQFQNKNLRDDYSTLQTELSASEEQNGILKGDLEKATRKLQSEHQLLIDQIENQMKENEEYKESANTALKQVMELQKDLGTIKKENYNLEQILRDRNVEKEKCQETIEALHMKLNEFAETIAELTTEVAMRDQEKSTLESTNVQLKEKCNEDKKLIEFYLHKSLQLQGEKRKLEKQLRERFNESSFCKKVISTTTVSNDSPNVPPAAPPVSLEKLDFTYSEDDIDQLLNFEDSTAGQSIQTELMEAENNKPVENDQLTTIENLKEEIVQLKNELKEHSQCSEVIHQHKYNIDFIVSEYEKSKAHAKELLDSNYELHHKLEIYKKTEDELKNELLELNYKFDNLLLEKETVQLDLQQTCLEKTNTSAENINFTLRLEKLQQELHILREEMETVLIERETLNNTKERLEKEKQDLNIEMNKTITENMDLKLGIDSYIFKLDIATKDINEWKENFKNLQISSEEKIHSLEKLQLKKQIQHSGDMEKLAVECDLLRTQLTGKSQSELDLFEKLSCLKKREERLSKEMEVLQIQKDAEILELHDQVDRSEHEKEKIVDECATVQLALHRELSRVVTELQEAKEKLLEKDMNEENLRIALVELNSNCTAVSKELLNLKQMRLEDNETEKNLIATKEFLNSELETCKKELTDSKTELDARRNEIVELITKLNSSGESNLHLQTENSELQHCKETATKEIERVRTKCSKLQSELATMTNSFEDLQKEVAKYRLSANEVSEGIESCIELSSPLLTVGRARKPVNTTDKLKHQVNKLRDKYLDIEEEKSTLQKQFDALQLEKKKIDERYLNLQETSSEKITQLKQNYEKAKGDLTKSETKLVFDRSRITELKCDVENLEKELVSCRDYRNNIEAHLKAAKNVLAEKCEQIAKVTSYVNGIWQQDLSLEENNTFYEYVTFNQTEFKTICRGKGPLDYELTFIQKQLQMTCVFLLRLGEVKQQQLQQQSANAEELDLFEDFKLSDPADGRRGSAGPSDIFATKPLHSVMHEIMAPTRFLSESCGAGDDGVFRPSGSEGADDAFRERTPSESSSTNTDTSDDTNTVRQTLSAEELVDDGTASAKQVEPQGRKYRSMSDGASGTDEAEPIDLFPSLPDSVLEKLGLLGDSNRKRLSEQDIEQKFSSLALSFTIDAATIKDRRVRQQMQRDQTEDNMASEINKLVEQIHHIKPLCIDAEKTELLQALLNQVDVIVHAAGHVSTSAERFGAVQHEDRLSDAVNLMIQHVAILKNQRDNARKCTKRMLQESRPEPGSVTGSRSMVLTHSNGRMLTGRRASIATFTDPKENNRVISSVQRFTRRTSDLSPRRVEVREWVGDKNDRLSILSRSNRSSRLELGGDLDKIREGTVETGPVNDLSADNNNLRHQEEIRDIALGKEIASPMPTIEISTAVNMFKEKIQKYMHLMLDKVRHRYPLLTRNCANLDLKKKLTHFMYLLLVFILISLIFEKDKFVNIFSTLFFSQGPWQTPPT